MVSIPALSFLIRITEILIGSSDVYIINLSRPLYGAVFTQKKNVVSKRWREIMYRDESKNLHPMIQYLDIIDSVVFMNTMMPLDIRLSIMKSDVTSPIIVFTHTESKSNTTVDAIRLFNISSDVDFFIHLMVTGADNKNVGLIEAYYESGNFAGGSYSLNLQDSMNVANVIIRGFAFVIE